MNDFLDFIKAYIQNAFAQDSDITASKKPTVYNAYEKNHEPSATKPEIQVRILDNSEALRYSTYGGKHANSIPLQITAYTGQMKIATIDKSAQEASIIFGDKIENCLYDLIYSNQNQNILSGRMMTCSPALPSNEGSTIYMTAVRFNFTVASPYVVG